MMFLRFCLLAALLGCCFLPTAIAQELTEALEKTTKAALAKVAPSIVQIRTIGGLEVIGRKDEKILRGQGPTTGVIVDPAGFIISSSFNFANKPSAITVLIPGKSEPLSAKVVAQDSTRMLTLLKVEATDLPVPKAAIVKELKLGQWAIAAGKTWADSASAPPNASVGIISALDRIWGKAIQTDAKVSPVNYGGPLLDLQGRVIGILVPLSPRSEGETAGVEWYDSGIGFAIPLEHIYSILPKLKEGKALRRGMLGVLLQQGKDQESEAPKINSVSQNSAASKAGLEPNDVITSINGKAIERQSQMRHILGPMYEGEAITLKVKRGEKEVDIAKLVLAGPPESHLHSYIGILPMRDDSKPGVQIRFIYPGSPAEKAGLKEGDRIVTFQGQPILDISQLSAILDVMPVGSNFVCDIEPKGGIYARKEIKLAGWKTALPETELAEATLKKAMTPKAIQQPRPGVKMPSKNPAKNPVPPVPGKMDVPKFPTNPKTGFFENSDPATGRNSWMFVPEKYDPNVTHGLVVWLHPQNETMQEGILRVWQPVCTEKHLILLSPKAANITGWMSSEVDVVQDAIRQVMREYHIDKRRVVVHGLGQGANLALYLGFDARDLVRGVAAVGGSLGQPPAENLAQQRLQFFLVTGDKDPDITKLRTVPEALKEKMFPVHYHEIAGQGTGYISDIAIFEKLILWIDSLDGL